MYWAAPVLMMVLLLWCSLLLGKWNYSPFEQLNIEKIKRREKKIEWRWNWLYIEGRNRRDKGINIYPYTYIFFTPPKFIRIKNREKFPTSTYTSVILRRPREPLTTPCANRCFHPWLSSTIFVYIFTFHLFTLYTRHCLISFVVRAMLYE